MRSALAIAEALIPGSSRTPAADETTVTRALAIIESVGVPGGGAAWLGALWMLDQAARLRTGRAFHSLTRDHQDALMHAWEKSPTMKPVLNGIAMILKTAHFDRTPTYQALGGKLRVLKHTEVPRYEQQIIHARDWTESTDVDCDVVVVGTGAGGGVVGTELALKGHAVVFVEEGRRQVRTDFTGSLVHAHTSFFRNMVTLGNSPVTLLSGKLVGGSTAVNGGTSLRPPPWVLDEWCETLGTDELRPDALEPVFDHVENRLQVALPERKFIGPIADVIDRGASALGWRAEPIPRNAVGCEGQGFCDFGCSTGARRSIDVAYLPLALERGAITLAELRADRVLMEGRRAVGIEAVDATGRTFRIRAKAVVLAGGSIPTPLLLLKQGLANASGEVGKNLSLHPSTGFGMEVNDLIEPHKYIPQGYMVSHFLREGWAALVAQPDLNAAHMIFPTTGPRLMRAMDSLDHMALFGLLIRDSTRGRVWFDVKGQPAITYNMNAHDADVMHQAMIRMGELGWQAGARRLYYSLLGNATVESRTEFEQFKRLKIRPADMALISYHPLGTCRMGSDPKTSVVDTYGQTHDVPGLFVVDGSIVPGPIGVNPQITIMGFATRAAERIHASL